MIRATINDQSYSFAEAFLFWEMFIHEMTEAECRYALQHTAVCCGQPSDEIVEYARENQIDLICKGASGTGFRLDQLFGSTVDHTRSLIWCLGRRVTTASLVKASYLTFFGMMTFLQSIRPMPPNSPERNPVSSHVTKPMVFAVEPGRTIIPEANVS